jgi:hypothetical protein
VAGNGRKTEVISSSGASAANTEVTHPRHYGGPPKRQSSPALIVIFGSFGATSQDRIDLAFSCAISCLVSGALENGHPPFPCDITVGGSNQQCPVSKRKSFDYFERCSKTAMWHCAHLLIFINSNLHKRVPQFDRSIE